MTNVNKTVAERLRERDDYTSMECALFNMLNGTDNCKDMLCRDCRKATYNTLADTIEAEQAELRNQSVDLAALDLLCDKLECGDANHRATAAQIRKAMNGAKPQLPEGIEWPRFTDGELVKFGDEYEDDYGRKSIVRYFSFKIAGGENVYRLNKEKDRNLWHPIGKSVKRYEPEVLDADGVPIKVGDTVYSVPDGREGIVERVGKGLNVRYGYRDVSVSWPGCTAPYLEQGGNLTHRKPDTLEDVQRDAEEFVKSLGDGRNAMYVFDLLERQRKLMGGE